MKKPSITIINFYLFTILLIITPFLMLQNYLQNAIGQASRAAINLDFINIPYTLIIALIFLALFFFFYRKQLTKKRLAVLGLILVLFAVGQMTADYYFGHHFYDLQNNWHYFAYGIFSYVAYRRFSEKVNSVNKLLLIIFLMALAISCFDEFIQIFISNRIFDLSDVAKDLWGNMAGCIFVFFFLEEGKGFPDYHFRQKKLMDYYRNPFSLICLELIFTFIFLYVSSQITDDKYKFHVGAIVLIIFTITFLIIHIGRNKTIRWIIRVVLLFVILIIYQSSHYGNSGTEFIRPGYISYNRIPLLFFDYMIFPDGSFRTVDKKEVFVVRDKQKIESLDPDILLIGKGSNGQGGRGWKDNELTEMVYNTSKHKIYQIIKLPNRQACETFNRLKQQKKKVLFIIHNE